MKSAADIICGVAEKFCRDFLSMPYACYTEHGAHALFFQRLYEAWPRDDVFTDYGGHKVCVIQKEYPTHDSLGKARRQNWDISIIKTPAKAAPAPGCGYDHLELAAAVEFGLNADIRHVEEDIRRLSHEDANVEFKAVVHLVRTSVPRFSARDASLESERIVSPDEIQDILKKREQGDLIVWYARSGTPHSGEFGAWRITARGSPVSL